MNEQQKQNQRRIARGLFIGAVADLLRTRKDSTNETELATKIVEALFGTPELSHPVEDVLMVDISRGGKVAIDINQAGTHVWVSVDGIVRFRCLAAEKIEIEDGRMGRAHAGT